MWQFLYTDSVACFIREYEAWWTLDIIGSYLANLRDLEFAVIAFDVVDGQCAFSIREDSDMEPVVKQTIEYTDLQISVKLFWENGVVLFPSDH